MPSSSATSPATGAGAGGTPASSSTASASHVALHQSLGGLIPATDEKPSSNFVTPMLTDMYQISMAYAYWKADRHNEHAIFDVFFRKNPFSGEFTIFAGLEEVLKYVQTFRFSPTDVAYLQSIMPPECEEGFFKWLLTLDNSHVKIYAIAEGSVVFPRVPLMRVEGPLAIAQLFETTLLNLTNYASLIATNAARFRLAAGPEKTILEFGLRRAQGPDGAMSATRYSYMGGCDGTSNVSGGMHFGIIPSGTHAHSLVSAYTDLKELRTRLLTKAPSAGGEDADFVDACLRYKKELGFDIASMGELAAFISFAQAFPSNFLALVDTYDTLQSGVPNFICVALALKEFGYVAKGIRLDSGDLAYLSRETRRMFVDVDRRYASGAAASSSAVSSGYLRHCKIVASNDINEAVLLSLHDQGHEIDIFGIGTNLVTCQAQPALGMVYKLVEINGHPRIKLSQDVGKVTIPGAKEVYRLIGASGLPILDLIIRVGEARPQAGATLLCRHPFDEKKRAYVTPAQVMPLLRLVWKGWRAPADDVALPAAAVEAAVAAAAAGVRVTTSADGKTTTTITTTTTASYTDNNGTAAANDATSSVSSSSSTTTTTPSIDEGVNLRCPFAPLSKLKEFVNAQLALLREDHIRTLNPTPYKVSVSPELYHYIHDLWMRDTPIPHLD